MFATSGPNDGNSGGLNQNVGSLLGRQALSSDTELQGNMFQRQGQGQMDIDSIDDPNSAGLDSRRFQPQIQHRSQGRSNNHIEEMKEEFK